MSDKIVAIATCGSCIYAQEFKADNSADCFGHPPTVLLLGAGRDALGRPAAQLETFVPRVKRDRPACALHKRNTDFAVIGSS